MKMIKLPLLFQLINYYLMIQAFDITTQGTSINTTVTEHQSTLPSEVKTRTSASASELPTPLPLNLQSKRNNSIQSVNASESPLHVSTVNVTDSLKSVNKLETASDTDELSNLTQKTVTMTLNNSSASSSPVPHYRLLEGSLSNNNWTVLNDTNINGTRSGDDVISIEHGHINFKLSYEERFPLTPVSCAIVLSLMVIVYFFMVKNRIEHCYMFITILIAGFGNLGAGFVLSSVQHWPVFYYISELLVLEPTLLGLKGNIEMCMASRLATQAGLGNMKSWRETIKMIWGNLGLDLTQATTVACIAASSVLAFKVISTNSLADMSTLYTGSILIASSMLTAVTTSFLLGSLLVTVIVLSYRMKINPDNIASPVAASLGDVITLTFLASYSSLIFNYTPSPPALPVPGMVIVIILLILLPLWFTCAYVNPYTKPSMWSGWTPIFIAVLISTCSGVILDAAVFRFTRYSVFQPVMNGIGGNLVAVHASRMSTSLHKNSTPGKLPSGVKLFRSPLSAFWDKEEANIEMARNLIAMAIPAHIVYIFITVALKSDIILTNYFLILYLASATLQIVILLYFATHLVNIMWKFGIDPDNTSIPILTATGDFLGSLFLYTSFLAMEQLGDYNAL